VTHEPDRDVDPEAPEADLAEQHTPATPTDARSDDPIPDVEVPMDADPADVLEQAQDVPYDDDEER